MRNNKTLVYLAVPYSHPNKKVREKRFNIVNKVAAKLISEGEHIFSPISSSHPISLAGDLPKSFDFWIEYDRAFLKCSKKLIVLMLKGWEESIGVSGEIKIAKQLNIPIEYLSYS